MAEAQAIGDLELGSIITQIIDALQNEHLEQHESVKRWAATFARIGDREHSLDQWPESLPIDHARQPRQQVVQSIESLDDQLLIEKTFGGTLLHDLKEIECRWDRQDPTRSSNQQVFRGARESFPIYADLSIICPQPPNNCWYDT